MLKKIISVTLLGLFVFSAGGAFAQETGTVAGTVVDSTTGEPLPGVNVVVEGENLGAATGANGKFEIVGVPTGQQTLVASFVGYTTKSLPVEVQANETTTVDIQMAPQAVGLDDVVVTALGQERVERAVATSVQQVEGADLERTDETNFIGNLAGKISGAQVKTSSNVSGSSRIILRGISSIAGENEPLIVVDGVPLDNSNFTGAGQASGSGGYDFGNAASMINPSNVESVSVLKGPSAAALYGSRAANGVIEITTKSGASQEGIGVTVQTGYTFRRLYNLPNYQNQYGGGSFSPFAMNDKGQLIVDYGTDQSWGPRLDGRMVREWFSWDDVNGFLGETTPWDPHPNNVANFFQTGRTWETSVAFSQGGDNFNYRTSVSNTSQAGVSPGSYLGRRNISFNGSLDLTDRLSTSITANYVDQETEKIVGGGYSDAVGPFQQFNTFGQRQIDLSEDAPMQDLRRPNGEQRSWNWDGLSGALTGDIIYMNNPYWTVRENYPTSDMQRVYGNFSLSYDLMTDLTLSGSVRRDYYTDRRQMRIAVGSQGQSDYTEELYEVGETNASTELNYDGDLTDNVSLQALAGANIRYSSEERNIASAEGGLSSAGVYTIENSVARPSITDYFQEQALFGIYADATLGYQDLVYVGGSVRNDWSSTLPEANNSYFYPSVRSSFIFSSLPAFQDQDVLSYGKLRVSWAQVGSDTDPYELSFSFPADTPFNGIPVQSLPNTLPNADLAPEITTGWEVGTELQFFNNRIALNATYYREETENQILAIGRSPASGFTEQQFNAGLVSNEGVELRLEATPVLTEAVQWDFSVNWSTNENVVEELEAGRVTVPAGTPPFGPDIVAQEGEPIGAFFGNPFARTEDGRKILSSGGDNYLTGDARILGSYHPDWSGGFSTRLSYKGLTARVAFDGQMGGQIWSLSNLFGLYSGLLQETVAQDIREVGINPEGVVNVGTAEDPQYEEFNGEVNPKAFFANLFGNHEAHLYDATHVKLREASLSYRLPGQWFGNVPTVQGLTVALIGRNLATLYKETPNFDPTAITLSTQNAQGIEAATLPPTRSYGFRLRLTF